MNRLTKDDIKDMNMLDLSHNQVFVKDREVWYRDFETEMTARDLARAMFARNGIECPANNEEFDEYMLELLQDGYETIDGMIALYYNALWSMAEIREKLKAYEDTGLEPEEVFNLKELYVKIKYFEIKEPYYALLKTESEEEARNSYNEIVADEDDFNKAIYTELTEEEAFKKFSDPEVWKDADDKKTLEQIKAEFYDKSNVILLIDSNLI